MSGLDLYQSQRALAMLFVNAALGGFLLGAVYDALRFLRIFWGDPADGKGQGKRPLPFACLLFWEDLLFMLTAAVSLILLCYYVNDGRIRGVAVAGMAGGFFVYSHTLGRLLLRLLRPGALWLRRLVRLCLGLALTPVRWLWRLTVGRAFAACRNRRTEGGIRRLTEAAARGFDLSEEGTSGPRK